MRISMLLHKSVEHDSRVRREARALQRAGHEVTVIHLPREPGALEGELDGYQVRSATPPAWVRRWLPFHAYRVVFLMSFVRALVRERPDAVHAHDCAMLVPGYIGARLVGGRLIYDSHEYAIGVAWRTRGWAALVWAIERLLIRRCAAVITVSDGIADRLQERYGLRKRPTVVRNLPDSDHEAAADNLRESLGIGEASLVLHQGAVAPGRGCLTLVRAVARLPTAHLVFLGGDASELTGEVAREATRLGMDRRVHLLPPVPIEQLEAYTAQADVGVSLLEDTCENHRLALPNKLFQYLAVGLPVVVSDLPEMRALANATGRGVTTVPDDPASVTRAIEAALMMGVEGQPADFPSWRQEGDRLGRTYELLEGEASQGASCGTPSAAPRSENPA